MDRITTPKTALAELRRAVKMLHQSLLRINGLTKPANQNELITSKTIHKYSQVWGEWVNEWTSEQLRNVTLCTKSVISGTVFTGNQLRWYWQHKITIIQKYQHTKYQKHKIPKKHKITQNKHNKKLKPASVASYDIRPGNKEGLFLFQRFVNLSLTYLYTYTLTAIGLVNFGKDLWKSKSGMKKVQELWMVQVMTVPHVTVELHEATEIVSWLH